MTRAAGRFAVMALLLATAACSDSASQSSANEDASRTVQEKVVSPATTPTRAPGSASAVEQAIAYDNMTYCTPAAGFRQMLGILSPMDANTGAPVKPDGGLRVQIDGARIGEPVIESDGATHTLNVALLAPWHGLQLVGITQVWTEESDHFELSLRFADRPADTIAALNRLGFALGRDGRRTEEGEALSTYLAVAANGAGSAFTCSGG